MEWSSRPEFNLASNAEVKTQAEALKEKVGEKVFDGPKLITLLLHSTPQKPVTNMDLDALESLIQSKRKPRSPSKIMGIEKKKKTAAPSKAKETGEKTKKKTVSEKAKAVDSQTSTPKKRKYKMIPKKTVRNQETTTTTLDPIQETHESFSTDHIQTIGVTSPSSTPKQQRKDKGIMVEDVPSTKRRKETVSREHIESVGVSQDSPPKSPFVPFGKKDWRLYEFLATLISEKDSLRNPDLADYIARNLILDADLANDSICGPLTATPGRLISFLPDILELEAKRTTAVKQAKLARRKNEVDQQEFKEKVFRLETRTTMLSGDLERLQTQIQKGAREHDEEVKNLKSTIATAEDKADKAEESERKTRLEKDVIEKELKEEKNKIEAAQGEIEDLKNQIIAERKQVSTLEGKLNLAAKQTSEIVNRFITGIQSFVEKKIPELSTDFFHDLPIRALIRGESEQEKKQIDEENQEEEVDEETNPNESNQGDDTNQVENPKE